MVNVSTTLGVSKHGVVVLDGDAFFKTLFAFGHPLCRKRFSSSLLFILFYRNWPVSLLSSASG